MSDIENREAAGEEIRMPLPPATFEFLIFSLRAQAEMHLGFMHFGGEEKPEPNFELARHHIDMLAVLQEKTKGNLSIEEQLMLDNSITELRFRFIQASEEAHAEKAKSQKA